MLSVAYKWEAGKHRKSKAMMISLASSVGGEGGQGGSIQRRPNQLLIETKLLIGQRIASTNQSEHLKSDSTVDVNKCGWSKSNNSTPSCYCCCSHGKWNEAMKANEAPIATVSKSNVLFIFYLLNTWTLIKHDWLSPTGFFFILFKTTSTKWNVLSSASN